MYLIFCEYMKQLFRFWCPTGLYNNCESSAFAVLPLGSLLEIPVGRTEMYLIFCEFLKQLFSFRCPTGLYNNCESSAFAVLPLGSLLEIPVGRTKILTGDMAEWLGRGLQNLVRRFKSACRLSLIYLFTLPRSSRGLGRRP